MVNRTKLTKKQRGFVKDYIATENGVQSALLNYDTQDYDTAKVIAAENLTKPYIKSAIVNAIKDEDLAEKHKELLNQVKIDYLVFPKYMSDEEIVDHVEAQGIEVLNIRESDKGKLAFYVVPDSQAIAKGLDMGYRLKGKYAPEKQLNINVELKPSLKLQALAEKLNAEL